ncbi:MAG: bifunctional diaminohydroxyphosphoribosylaminopyrimidine deaminase/5-amino-6-(5-phosphoribosylamino)uracil reductase RibD [Granulosicoccus sp.]
MQSHEHFMQRALELASRGSGCTSPNPLVGCVGVREGVIIGEGWHEQYGKAHAEVNALEDVKNRGSAADTQGATLYVTLEPCNHHGLTPPCTKAIVDAGIKQVFYALADPNPCAAGGARYLASQGVEVENGPLKDEARYQNRFFLKHVATRRPYVIAKSATSLDGRVATRTGDSQWITGEAARQRGHELRQAVDAIIVGADTVLGDDPSLTVRLPETIADKNQIRHPRPIVLDSKGRIPLHVKLLDGSLPTRTLIITSDQMQAEHRQVLTSRGYEVLTVANNAGGIGADPSAILDALGQRGIHSVLLEGGAAVHGSFRDANLIDEVWTFMAPIIIGGDSARSTFAGLGSAALSDATQLDGLHIENVGRDLLIRSQVVSNNTMELAKETVDDAINSAINDSTLAKNK